MQIKTEIEDETKSISVKIASEITGIGYLTIIRAIHNGNLSARKPGKEFILEKDEVMTWANRKYIPKKKIVNNMVTQQ